MATALDEHYYCEKHLYVWKHSEALD